MNCKNLLILFVTLLILSCKHRRLGTGSPAASVLHGGSVSGITSQLNNNGQFVSFTSPDAANPTGSNPKAYLTVLFFDERFNFIPPQADGSGSVIMRVADNVADQSDQALTLANIKAPKNGYAYIYISNESTTPVYFDNLKVSDNAGSIIEEDHYYAYGLKIAAISSTKIDEGNEGVLKNNYLYNDKELWDDGGLNWYDYGFRNYDAQIGRFTQLDPLTDRYPELTPYQYASDEPIGNVDLDGLEGVLSTASTAASVAAPAAGYLNTAATAVVLQDVVVTSTRVAKSSSLLSVAGSFLKGFGSSLLGTVKGVANIVIHPLQTAAGISNLILHPVSAITGIARIARDTYKAFKSGNADAKAKILGGVTAQLGLLLVPGAEEADLANDASKVEDVSEAEKVAEASKEINLVKSEQTPTKFEEEPQPAEGTIQQHHSDPKFMGGDEDQKLTSMDKSEHQQLHNDLNEHLDSYKDAHGNTMRPKRGNPGATIRQNFSRQQRINALKDFYKGPGAKYSNAAKDFFTQHP